jgi:hypothetical protein
MASQLFRTKPLSMLLAEEAGSHRLRRVLGPVQLTAWAWARSSVPAFLFSPVSRRTTAPVRH